MCAKGQQLVGYMTLLLFINHLEGLETLFNIQNLLNYCLVRWSWNEVPMILWQQIVFCPKKCSVGLLNLFLYSLRYPGIWISDSERYISGAEGWLNHRKLLCLYFTWGFTIYPSLVPCPKQEWAFSIRKKMRDNFNAFKLEENIYSNAT